MKRLIILLVVVALPLASSMPVHEWERNVHYRSITLYAPAVTQAENGSYFGVLTEINVTMMNGSGNVFVITTPLTQLDMQGSAKLAVDVAGMVTGIDVSKYDFLFQVKADSPIVGGPSAGATMCIASICLLKSLDTNSRVIMTGMINPDGSIGPVGGILEKGQAAGEAGMKYFLIPKGQSIEYKTVWEKMGPFIIQKAKKVNVSESLYENYSLIVREVEDINQALAYFTNYTFTEEKSNKAVITAEYYREIMKPLAQQMIKEANESYMEADEMIKKTYIPVGNLWEGNPRGVVLNALDDSKSNLDDAQYAYKNAFYYYSISSAFQSKINSLFVKYACMYYNGTGIQSIYENVTQAVDKAFSTAKDTEIRGLVTLQCVGAAQQRALDAKEYVNRSESNHLQKLYDLAYAMERSKTVYWWLNLSKYFNESYGVNESWITGMAEKYYDYAQNIFSYAKILSEETGYSGKFVNKANSLLQKAGEQKENYPAASLFNSLESIANANLAIEMVGIGKDTEIADKINRNREISSYAIEKARNMSIEPILAVSYAEFGRSFEGKDNMESLTYYKYAYMIANMLCLSTGYNVTQLHKSENSLPSYGGNGGNRESNNFSLFQFLSITTVAFLAGIAAGIFIGRNKRKRLTENVMEENNTLHHEDEPTPEDEWN